MMLAGPNHTGVYTVSINPSMTSHGVSQSAPLTVPALNIQAPTQPMLSPRPNAQPLVTTPGQLVNVTAVRSSPVVKSHACSYCQKSFSSRYNVNRHEKICKLNTNAPVAEVVVQQLPQHNKDSQVKMYMCHLCQKTFTSADSLNRHQKKCKDQRGIALPHSSALGSSQQRRLHICKYCAKDFSTKWNVIRHERLFHKPGDLIVVPETMLNGTIADVPISTQVIGKPERYCRFCGNYFSSKYNAHRHEKICTRIKDGVEIQTTTQNPEDLQKPMQVMFSTAQSPPISLTLSSQPHQLQQHTPQRQQITQQQAQQQQQISQQQQQQNLATQQQQQQQVQHQHTIQTVQGHQLLPQQTMLLIDPHHLQPFHVCKFCNKQMSTRCDAVDSQTLSNVQTVATVTGQHMQLPAGSSAQLTSLMAPVMASLPQVALVQPHGQLPTMIQQQSHLQQQQQQQQQQQVKQQQPQQPNQLQTSTRGQQGTQQQQQQQQQQQLTLQQQLSLQQHQTQMSQGQQQITQLQPMQQVQTQNQQVQQPQQQIQQDQTQQQNFPHQQQQASVERPHACRYCDKHFATKWYLDQHERIHTGEADMCKQCGKYFVTRWHLEKHMRVHLPGQARKMKKDSQAASSSTVAVASEQTSLTTEIKDLPFSQQMIIGSNTVVVSGDGQHIASSASVSSASESIRALSERPQSATYVLSADHTQYFLPGLGSGTPQSVAVVPSSASQEQDHNDQSQQASTIDKSQISITY